MLLDATATAVAATGSATITLTVVDGDPGAVNVGDLLLCDTGGSYEAAPITAVNQAAKQLTATFASTHLANFAVRVCRGSYLGGVFFNTAGTTMVLALYNGHPSSSTGKLVASITQPAAAAPYPLAGAFDQGCFYTYVGGAAGDITVLAMPSL
jgi:hypothetical protein